MSADQLSILRHRLLIEKLPITYRGVSRLCNVHVNDAKKILFALHEQAASTSRPLVATYFLAGQLSPASIAQDEPMTEETDSKPAVNGGQGSQTSQVNVAPLELLLEAKRQPERITRRAAILVSHDELQEAKKRFENLSSYHIYSLSPAAVPDPSVLTTSTAVLIRTDRACAKSWANSGDGQTLGLIWNPHRGMAQPVPKRPMEDAAANQPVKKVAKTSAVGESKSSKPDIPIKTEKLKDKHVEAKQPADILDGIDFDDEMGLSSSQHASPKKKVRKTRTVQKPVRVKNEKGVWKTTGMEDVEESYSEDEEPEHKAISKSPSNTSITPKSSQPASSIQETKPAVKRNWPPPKPTAAPPKPLATALSQMMDKKRRAETSLESLLSKRTSGQILLQQSFRDESVPLLELCEHTTRPACSRHLRSCSKVHFQLIRRPQTDLSLGACSYLSTCHHPNSCRYLHYDLEEPTANTKPFAQSESSTSDALTGLRLPPSRLRPLMPAQWIDCDLRTLDLTVLGKFSVVMADAPWDIRMDLPYGTMTDDEMKSMSIGSLQDDGGLMFLWVTGRALELGRECLKSWAYERVDEIVWVKTNQLQRLIRTGRTGHWLNHSKEHCIVAYKRPKSWGRRKPTRDEQDALLSWTHRGVDCDVIVSEMRETSRKPDEIYEIIERMAPSGRKIELFGRKHNFRPGWLTLGNQIGSDCVHDPHLVERVNVRYPDRALKLASNEDNRD
ncbi:uncharacterized protein L969DRAFT_92644 [Mixia osmundae IAM 14324]|uniref:mRNA m(6)A methyltransferase n=1 Tax=Mixia osmundae (strain CBS 9802 / IAM 14324 / JCM 22182 / KY 12970) TaxID=764103 RepID=G7DY52_MIXOS|nr:uncharacterized protein L969DRAFT_92644 [Mixia osmundae IAM 14324]KEI41414.1 hypothetical protein L969DRAFT_92644 [Mixia osmundae IAM 14324]GAA95512.1 hypothetical protein E5Q_02167 [Mixia osmundae IAM 14324]